MTLFDTLIMQPKIPNWLFRLVIKHLVKRKLATEKKLHSIDDGRITSMVKWLSQGPIATDTKAANNQHYEVPPTFFQTVLGKNLK